MSGPALSLRSLVRHHAGNARPIVDGLTLDVRPGELLALLGPSGAGKSTTLRMIAGYERPDRGTVHIDGDDVTTLPPERRGVGMVFQHYALFPHLSVEENVAFGLAARGVSRGARAPIVRQALAGVGLDDAAARSPRALSGGEQQRVALARALVIEPRVLLLDEPLSSLDPTRRIAMRDELRATLRASHVATLLVTHDQDDAFAVADRVALLDAGRLLQVDTPAALYDRPASRAVASFVGTASIVPARRIGDDVEIEIGSVAQRTRAIVGHDDVRRDDVRRGGLAVLRPESVALVSVDDADAWRGHVVACHFADGAMHVQIALDGVSITTRSNDRAIREGDRVGVRLAGRPVALVSDS